MFVPLKPFDASEQEQHTQEMIKIASEKYPNMPINEAIKKMYEESLTNKSE